MTDPVRQPRIMGGGTAALWAGVIGVPLLWAAQFQLQYALVPWVCAHHSVWLLRLTSVLSLLIGGGLAWIAWDDFRRASREQSASVETGVHSRARFLGGLAVLVAALFLLLIAAQAVPSLFIDPCSD